MNNFQFFAFDMICCRVWYIATEEIFFENRTAWVFLEVWRFMGIGKKLYEFGHKVAET